MMAHEDEAPPLDTGRDYPVWSPFDAHEAAVMLEKLLQQEKTK